MRRRPVGGTSEWICDEDGCRFWRRLRSWSSADSTAKKHHERTGHDTLVQRTVTRRYG